MNASSKKEKDAMKDKTSDMADSAMKNYEQAVRAGLRIQEETGRWWSNMFTQSAFTGDWQKRFNDASAMTNGFAPIAQKRMEEMMDFMQKNSRTTAELMKKAVDAAQTPTLADSQAKWMDFWTASIGAMRNNTETMTQIGSKAIDAWIDYVRKNSDLTDLRTPKST